MQGVPREIRKKCEGRRDCKSRHACQEEQEDVAQPLVYSCLEETQERQQRHSKNKSREHTSLETHRLCLMLSEKWRSKVLQEKV